MFTPQALGPTLAVDPNADFSGFVNRFETSQGRWDQPLGDDGVPWNVIGPDRGRGETSPMEPEARGVDVWGDVHNYPMSQPGAGGANVNEGGRGDRAPLPKVFFPERPPRNFVAYFMHAPYQGWQELRENVGGHVVVRWMPNAGQAQGGMGGWSPQVNQRRILPDRWDATAFING